MKLKFSSPQEYREHFARLVQLERRAQQEAMLAEIRRLSGPEREKLGRAILGLRASDRGPWLGGRRLYLLWREREFETEIGPGDMVLVSSKHPLTDGVQGIVLERTKHTLQVVLEERVRFKRVRVDLYSNETTFNRMLEALARFEEGRFPVDVLLGQRPPRLGEENLLLEHPLNEFQREAVRLALGSELALIHGPFGTGKTTTLAAVIAEAVKRGWKVLAAADSNIAVDNLAEALLKRGIEVVRVGHPAKVLPELRRRSLDLLVEEHTRYKAEVKPKWEEIERLREAQSQYPRPTPSLRRGLTYEEILKLAKHYKGARGISRDKMRLLGKWVELEMEVRALREKALRITDEIVSEILEKAPVVASTCSGAGSEFLVGREFDLVVIDEATQATEPSALIPLTKAPRAVLAGDHRQLPPTVVSLEAERKGLGVSMFERFIELYPEAARLLRVQYRMHPEIMRFPNEKFYGGKLIAAPGLERLELSDILKAKPNHPALDDRPVVLVPVKGAERQRKGSTSRENPAEAQVVREIVEELLRAGAPPEAVGVIAPYDDQVKLLKEILPEGVEVKTVDGFQGREKEVIVLSLVRSNPQGEIGFLKDRRRLNVALTRAKRKLVIVCDPETLKADPVYGELVKYLGAEL